MRRPLRILAGAVLALAGATACSGVTYRQDIAERIATVDRQHLREHVQALDAIGPRPVSAVRATSATVDYITRRLHQLGYDVEEELIEVTLTSRFVAIVRPLDDPEAEPTEVEVPAELALCGPHAMQARSDRFVRDGWRVEAYSMRLADEAQVFAVPNLIASRRGTSEPDHVIELGAHYDTVPTGPGASDNSSGVAALLEIARIAANTSTKRTIRFCFFGAEEIGLRGSERHVETILGSPETRFAGLLNLDSVGFTVQGPGSQQQPDDLPWFFSPPDEGDFVAVIGDWPSGWLGNVFEDAVDAYTPELPYYSANRLGSRVGDAFRSDHASYWRAGLPAVFLTDTGEFRSPHYHRPSDTHETVDYTFLEAVARATAAAVLHWAELDIGTPANDESL